jgi:hypothetical protein
MAVRLQKRIAAFRKFAELSRSHIETMTKAHLKMKSAAVFQQ